MVSNDQQGKVEKRQGKEISFPGDCTHLSDFALFLSVMKNKEAYTDVLSIILDETDLELVEVKVEQVILNKSGKRAIRLDAWALDAKNRQFSTEMQNDTKKDDVRKRSRYYQAMMDTPILKSGKRTKYKELPSTTIIFITQEDIFQKDLAQYTFTERCEELPELHLEDGTTKIFLNMKSKNGRPELISLLQYMKNTTLNNPDIVVEDSRITHLAAIVEEVKQSEEWEAVQMNIYEMGMERGMEKGMEQGIEQGKNIGVLTGKAFSILDILEELGTLSEELREMILQEKDTDKLKYWLKLAAKVSSIEEFSDKISVNNG